MRPGATQRRGNASGPALDALSGFTAELARDRQSLSSLVSNGASR